jgi:AcrR family transcriptional regulator
MASFTIHPKQAGDETWLLRRRIIELARRHFLAHGFRGITMDDLARELGMSKKTLYAFFASKTDLLQAVILNKLDEVEASLDALSRQPPPDFGGNLQKLLSTFRQHTDEIRPPFIRDLQREAPEIFAVIETRRRKLIHRQFKRLFDQGRRAGTIRKDIPVALMIEILLGTADAIVNPTKLVELGLTPQTAFSAILRMMLQGVIVRPPNGAKIPQRQRRRSRGVAIRQKTYPQARRRRAGRSKS